MLAHRLAKLSAVATFVMLIIGGTINTTGSSLACEASFGTCKGEVFPEMTGGVLYEHGHRLAGIVIGLLQIALTVTLWRRRRDLRGLAALGLVVVCVQGALGIITVKYLLPWYVSTTHLLTGIGYFTLLVYLSFRTRRPKTVPELDADDRGLAALGSARRWIVFAACMVLGQILLGGLVRHFEAVLSCLGMPSCSNTGDYWPDTGLQRLQMVHRGFGVLVGLATITAAIQVARRARAWTSVRTLMMVAPVLVALQITLGIYTVLTIRAVPVTVAHFGGAIALWFVWISAVMITAPRRSQVGKLGEVVR